MFATAEHVCTNDSCMSRNEVPFQTMFFFLVRTSRQTPYPCIVHDAAVPDASDDFVSSPTISSHVCVCATYGVGFFSLAIGVCCNSS